MSELRDTTVTVECAGLRRTVPLESLSAYMNLAGGIGMDDDRTVSAMAVGGALGVIVRHGINVEQENERLARGCQYRGALVGCHLANCEVCP